jgi:hypothetical protein
MRKSTVTVRGNYATGGRYAFVALMRYHVINAPIKSPVQKPDQAPSVTQNIGSVMSHTSMRANSVDSKQYTTQFRLEPRRLL